MIIDASVAVPWLIDTPFSTSARKLKDQGSRAPGLILVETANALLKYFRGGQLQIDDLHLAIKTLPLVLDELVADATLIPAAAGIAAANHHKIYDCLYLALAIERDEPLATADRKLAALARSLGIAVELIEPA